MQVQYLASKGTLVMQQSVDMKTYIELNPADRENQKQKWAARE